MARPIKLASIHLSLAEVVTVCAGCEVFMVVDLYFTDCWRSASDYRLYAECHLRYFEKKSRLFSALQTILAKPPLERDLVSML